jgi:hypothetical protein
MKRVQTLASAMVMAAAAAAAGQGKTAAPATTIKPGPGEAMNVQIDPRQAAAIQQKARALQAEAEAMHDEYRLALPGGSLTLVGAAKEADKPALVVTQSLAPQERSEWEEDLAVMSQLVGKAIGDAGEPAVVAMGIPVRHDRRPVSAVYIEGCGVLVSGSVGFPLKGSAASEDAKGPVPAVSAWDQAKQELGAKPAGPKSGVASALVIQPFDAQRVEAFKKALLAVLAEGKHFRHLPADEWVIITLTGPGEGTSQARLTIKARKADMDAAKGEQLESFAAQVKSAIE